MFSDNNYQYVSRQCSPKGWKLNKHTLCDNDRYNSNIKEVETKININ